MGVAQAGAWSHFLYANVVPYQPLCLACGVKNMIVDFRSEDCKSSFAGGKAYNLWKLGRRLEKCKVPPWFCLTTDAFQLFIQVLACTV